MQTATAKPGMKKFQVRQAGPIRLTSAATPFYNTTLAKVSCVIYA
jgi:hypothetical protein